MFKILDKLKSTANGLDLLPAWFLTLGAPFCARPLAGLFNLSITISFVSHQFKHASIRPISKMSSPVQDSDFRPVSITSILSRIMERPVVSPFLYSAFNAQPPSSISFVDQFAFRPTGSTTATIVAIIHTVTHLLATNPYVIVISLDFGKAFDTVRIEILCRRWPSWTFQSMYTTGWWTFSVTAHMTRSTLAINRFY